MVRFMVHVFAALLLTLWATIPADAGGRRRGNGGCSGGQCGQTPQNQPVSTYETFAPGSHASSIEASAPGTMPTNVAGLLADQINAARQSNRLPPLVVSPSLMTSAGTHSLWMSQNGLSHYENVRGRYAPWDRISQAGYQWSYCGECITAGQPTPQAAAAAWMGDAPHRRIVLSRQAVHLGTGVMAGRNGQLYWTMDVAAPLR